MFIQQIEQATRESFFESSVVQYFLMEPEGVFFVVTSEKKIRRPINRLKLAARQEI